MKWRRKKYPDASFDFVNAGISGYSVEKSQLNLDHRVAPLAPDVIVIYHATNDITKDTRALAKEKGVYEGHGDAGTWLAKYSLAWALIEKNLLFRQRMKAAEAPVGRLELGPGDLGPAFEERLTRLVRSSQAVASIVVLPTFSHRVRREQSAEERLAACNTSLYYMPYMTPDGCLEAFETYNEVIRKVAAKTGALLVEGEFEIPGDLEHFNDSVHLIGPGLAIMAQRVGPPLLRSEAFSKLVASRREE